MRKPRVHVIIEEPIHDPEAWARAMKVLEEHFLELMCDQLSQRRGVRKLKPETT